MSTEEKADNSEATENKAAEPAAETPEATSDTEATDKPAAKIAPEATAAPEAKITPEATAAPAQTEKPVVTGRPAPSQSNGFRRHTEYRPRSDYGSRGPGSRDSDYGPIDGRDSDDRSDSRSSYLGQKSRTYFRRKVCRFCTQNLRADYKRPDVLRRFITERGKILPRRITGTCAKHQRDLAVQIKRARVLAFLLYTKK